MSIDSKKVLEITSIDKPRVNRSKKTPGKAWITTYLRFFNFSKL